MVNLSKVQGVGILVVVTVILLILMGCSFMSPPMYQTDVSEEDKVCPEDYLKAIIAADKEIEEQVIVPP